MESYQLSVSHSMTLGSTHFKKVRAETVYCLSSGPQLLPGVFKTIIIICPYLAKSFYVSTYSTDASIWSKPIFVYPTQWFSCEIAFHVLIDWSPWNENDEQEMKYIRSRNDLNTINLLPFSEIDHITKAPLDSCQNVSCCSFTIQLSILIPKPIVIDTIDAVMSDDWHQAQKHFLKTLHKRARLKESKCKKISCKMYFIRQNPTPDPLLCLQRETAESVHLLLEIP